MRNLADCPDEFQTNVQALAEKYDHAPEFVYGLWVKYANACQDYDQSPAWLEFENWNKEALCSKPTSPV